MDDGIQTEEDFPQEFPPRTHDIIPESKDHSSKFPTELKSNGMCHVVELE